MTAALVLHSVLYYVILLHLYKYNITGVAHKIQYGPVMFEVLLGNPIYMTDNTQNGTIIVYPIFELKSSCDFIYSSILSLIIFS